MKIKTSTITERLMVNSMKKKIYFIINILISVAVYIVNVFYQYHNFNFTLKCIASGLFAILSIINVTYFIKEAIKKENLKYPLAMMVGSIFCFLGDAFIHANFILGVVLFALGHVFYVIGYCMLQNFQKLDFIIGGGLGLITGLFVALCPLLKFDAPILKVACVVYALILSFMVGKTVSNFINSKNKLNMYLMIGAILFLISDLCLLICWFWHVGVSRTFNHICMGTYYPANLLFAYSIYYYLKEKND